MERLILFDIDGTLLINAAGHRAAFSKAFQVVYNIDTNIDIIIPNGMTDQQIIIEVLKKHGLSENEIKSKIADCMKVMIEYYDETKDQSNPIVLEGVQELLEELEKKNYILGLVTGNLEPIARGKLERVNLNNYFKVGGFGSDDINRTNLVKLAIKRTVDNFDFKYNNNVILFGDAPQDMKAGNEAGIFTIGVTSGIFSKEELEKAAANCVVDSLKDTNKILNTLINMSKIAIDVVLLPSEEMMDKAIEINKELLKTNENKIVLDKEKCLPHISLCMGCIKEDKILEIKNILDKISKEFTALNLIAKSIKADIIPTGKKVSGLHIENIDELQKLHEAVIKRLWKYLSYNVEISMLFNPPEVEEVTFYWIRNYAKKYHNPSSFHPHITVGFGETDKFQFPIEFTASKIALCQLGNYCTCRKIIISSDLT